MAYAHANFKTKKAFKDAVAQGAQIRLWSPGPFPPKTEGQEFVEGPHFPEPHRWYAAVTVKNGIIQTVK